MPVAYSLKIFKDSCHYGSVFLVISLLIQRNDQREDLFLQDFIKQQFFINRHCNKNELHRILLEQLAHSQ